MGLDYYKVLGVPKEATDLEIKQAYKSLAISNNPRYVEKNSENVSNMDMHISSHESKEKLIINEIKAIEALQMYHLVGEAYDVLTDSMNREIFDSFGERGLKEGLMGPNGFISPYAYHGDPDRTFREFFGSENPYTDLVTHSCGLMDENLEGGNDSFKPIQPPVYRDLWLTMDEFYTGCVKKVLISKKVLLSDNRSTEIQTKVLTIEIEAGIPSGKEYTFPGEGDQGASIEPADVVFVIREMEHEFFKRDGDNLIRYATITLTEALTGTSIPIRALNKRYFRIGIVHIVEPGYEKIVKGEGFTVLGKPGVRGDLIIRCQVKFPNVLSQEQKKILKVALEDKSTDGKKSCYQRPQPVSFSINKDIICLGEP